MEEKKVNIIEHEYEVLDTEKRNKNHRFYPDEVIGKIISDPRLEKEGIDVEHALDEETEIDDEFLKDHLSCGVVNKLRKDGTKLFANVRFKINELTKDIYAGTLKPEDLTVVPKGKGSVMNQRVQEDYELYGFNLVKKNESSFSEEEVIAETAKEEASE